MSSRYREDEEEEWKCSRSSCGRRNYGNRTSCKDCGRERQDRRLKRSHDEHSSKKSSHESSSSSSSSRIQLIGKEAAQKSKGLFSADDWQCSRCGNVNWARRGTCNMCNAPKVDDVQERTGLGGGYNDRGVIEYKSRRGDDSDDEFDDFGRRRKKRRQQEEEKKTKEKDIPRKSSEEEKDAGKGLLEKNQDEEEEDDDEDCDLSKYKLDSDDDEDD